MYDSSCEWNERTDGFPSLLTKCVDHVNPVHRWDGHPAAAVFPARPQEQGEEVRAPPADQLLSP